MADAASIQVACDRCTQGVMDSTNSHLLGTCGCECHASVAAYTLVSNDQGDWIGLYGPDGRLIEEGHSFSESRILELVRVAHDRAWDVDLSELGSLPGSLGEVAALGGKLTAVRP